MPKCKGCGAEIIWIKTKDDKSMPCDPEQLPFRGHTGAKGKYVVIENGLGRVVSGELEYEPRLAIGMGYVPHWATCPEFKKFKGK